MKTTMRNSIENFTRNLFVITGVAIVVAAFPGCSSSKKTSGSNRVSARKLLLRDEGMSQLAFVDLADSTKNWYVKVSPGRDIQLVGNGRVLIGTDNGYEEHDIKTGAKIFEVTSFAGTVAARRLRNGNTLLTGLNMQGKQGIVLLEIDKDKNVKHTINFPTFPYARLVRETTKGTFLVTADDTIFECNAAGEILWQAKITGRDKPHAWQALRLSNGNTIVSAGFAANFQVFGADGKLISTITGPADVNPHFFAGYQILDNGDYVVTNWQGHGPSFGASGTQVLEYNPAGQLVWSWKQNASRFSSLQGVIVLDGLDLNKLYVEDGNGVLKAVE
jgi:hypothetical protein